MSKNILALPGDGIGPEIMPPALAVLRAVGDFNIQQATVGGAALDIIGNPLPPGTIDAAKSADAVLFGAAGGPKWEGRDDGRRPEQAIIGLRVALQTHANLRPVRFIPGLAKLSTSKPDCIEGADYVIVRELLSGAYTAEMGRDESGVAFEISRLTPEQVDNVGRTAFELALSRSRDKGLKPLVTSVDKANVKETSRLWRERISRLHETVYPEVELEHIFVDNMEHQINANPRHFNVIVTENEHGDILSEAGATLTGAIGVLASASVSLKGPWLFEPPHGSAPDKAGRGIANPLGMINCLPLMLEQLGMTEEARAVEAAVDRTLQPRRLHRRVVTPDLGGRASTAQVGREVLKNLH